MLKGDPNCGVPTQKRLVSSTASNIYRVTDTSYMSYLADLQRGPLERAHNALVAPLERLDGFPHDGHAARSQYRTKDEICKNLRFEKRD